MILLSVPSHDTVCADFALSLCNLAVYSAMSGVKLRIQSPRSSILPQSRNLAVKELLSNPAYTHLMFLDSDMAFPADVLLRFLRHDVAVVGATYARRVPSNGDAVTAAPEELYDVGYRELLQAEKLPTGCLLLRRDVVEAIPMPVFEFGWNEADQNEIGEDLMLCRKILARDDAPVLWLDPVVSRQLIHLGMTGFALRGRDAADVMGGVVDA